MSTNVNRAPVLQPYQIVRLLPFWGRCWCTGSRRQPLHRCNLWTRKRAHIEDRLFGFCWAFQSFRKRCYQHQNRMTGAARSTTFPRTTPIRKLLERQSLRNPRSDPYGSGTPIPKPYGRNLSKPNIAPVI